MEFQPLPYVLSVGTGNPMSCVHLHSSVTKCSS